MPKASSTAAAPARKPTPKPVRRATGVRAVPPPPVKKKRSRTGLLVFGIAAGSPLYVLGIVLCWAAFQEPVDVEPMPSQVPTIAAIAPYAGSPSKFAPPVEKPKVAEASPAAPAPPPPAPSNSLLWPADSAIVTSGFGVRIDPVARLDRRVHRGIDVRSPMGAPVLAAADGVVIHAGKMTGGGRTVKLVHDGTLATTYMHLSRVDVAVGDKVRAGDRVGASGSSGRSTGPHLHFEVWENGQATDPLGYRWRAPSQAASERLAGAVARTN